MVSRCAFANVFPSGSGRCDTETRLEKSSRFPSRWAAPLFAVLYLLLGGAWIYFSDEAILILGGSPEAITRHQTLKGAAYVVVTAVFAYWYLEKTLGRQRRTLEALARREEELRRLNAGLEQRVNDRTADLAAAKERAESADRLKSAFLATMSHELRTPLNSIIGFTGILLQRLSGPLTPEQEKQLGMVQGSARHLLELINDVLDLSKIEAGQLEIEAKPFVVRESVGHAVSMVAPQAEKKGLSLAWEVSPEAGEMVGDRRRFEQILINLLNNAVKFTGKGRVRVECAVRGRELVTRVADTGIGIGKEDLEKLFQPFRQIDTGLTRNHEGSGLGLSICRKLVERMGGGISLESERGAGSVFTFTLPLGKE
ncbi:MAG: ATP-binding protein [Thermodesulfobacteriota bacterium]